MGIVSFVRQKHCRFVRRIANQIDTVHCAQALSDLPRKCAGRLRAVSGRGVGPGRRSLTLAERMLTSAWIASSGKSAETSERAMIMDADTTTVEGRRSLGRPSRRWRIWIIATAAMISIAIAVIAWAFAAGSGVRKLGRKISA